MEIEDASPERESRGRKGGKRTVTRARKGKKREVTSSSGEEVEEPEYVEDDTENEKQKAPKPSDRERRGKPSKRKIKSSSEDEKDTTTQKEEKEKEMIESTKSSGRRIFTTKSPERSSRSRGRRSHIDVEGSVSKDAARVYRFVTEDPDDVTTTGENHKTSSTADTASTSAAVARERPKRGVGNSGGRNRSLSKENSAGAFGETETSPPASPTRKSGRTRTSTAKFAEHVVDRYDATSRQQLRRGAKDRCKESLQEQSESDLDAVMHEVTIALPSSDTKVVQSRPSGRRNKQQLQEEHTNAGETTAEGHIAAVSGEEVLVVPSATEVNAEKELENPADEKKTDKVDEATQGEESIPPKANTPARPRGGWRGRGRHRGRARGRPRTTQRDVASTQLDGEMEVELTANESITQTTEESGQQSGGQRNYRSVTTPEHSPGSHPAEDHLGEEGTEPSTPIVHESIKPRGGRRSHRGTGPAQSDSDAEAAEALGELRVVAVGGVTAVDDVTVQPMSGRRSKRQTAALSALKSRALLEDHSDSDASMSTQRSSRFRSGVGRTETPPRTTARGTGRRSKPTRTATEHEDQPSTTTEEYCTDADSDTQGKRKRKTKTKLSLRQRNARRKKGSTGSLDLEPEVNESEPEVSETVEENAELNDKQDEGTAETNTNAERSEDVRSGEEQNDNEKKREDDTSRPLVKNLPLKMRIRISRMTEEEIEKLSNRSDMDESAAEETPARKSGRKGRKAREKSKLTAESDTAGFQGAIHNNGTEDVDNNNAADDENDEYMKEDAENKEDGSGRVANDKHEFSGDYEKEGDAGEVDEVDKDTAEGENNPPVEGTELPVGESTTPPAEDGTRATAGGRRGTGAPRRGRGGRGRKGRPPSKRARVEESAIVTISDSD